MPREHHCPKCGRDIAREIASHPMIDAYDIANGGGMDINLDEICPGCKARLEIFVQVGNINTEIKQKGAL
jgi:rubredoxin